jgi:NADH-quinone oxidoreductase subunit E
MLTEKETFKIDEAMRHYAQPQEAAVDALQIVQRHRGWVSDESLADLAAFMRVSTAGLDAVATFYNRIYRKPVGKHVILVCDSVSCWIMGYRQIMDHIRFRLGLPSLYGTSGDGLFTLMPSVCLGACDHAPVMMVDDELYRDLTIEKVDRILEEYRGKSPE